MQLFRFQRTKWFWKIRHVVSVLRFGAGKFLFSQKERAKQTKDGITIGGQILRSILPLMAFSVVVVFALELGEHLLVDLTITRSIFFDRVIRSVDSLRDAIADSVQNLTALFSVTASISGIFLGLYFTAISVVAGSTFSTVPGNLRDLLLQEKVGNHYIKILGVLTSISLVLLGLSVYGHIPGVLSTLLVILLGCFGVLGFLKLGMRAFHFFDPASLGNSLFHELRNTVRRATVNGFRWNDPSFQAHYQKIADKQVRTLRALIRHCTRSSRSESGPLTTIMQHAAGFLAYYARMRSRIPSDSMWYARTPRYKNHFFQDSTELSVALKTHTATQPEMVADQYWLEERLVEELSFAVSWSVQTKNMDAVYGFCELFQAYAEVLGANLEIDKGKEIIFRMLKPVEQYFDSDAYNDDDCREMDLAVLDYIGLVGMSLVLGFVKAVGDPKLHAMLREATRPDGSAMSIYSIKAPPSLLPRVELVRSRLQFEKSVERTRVSPDWYVKHLVLIRFLELLKDAAKESIALLEDFYISTSDRMLRSGRHVISATHCLRGLEMCNKLNAHLPTLKSTVNELQKGAVCRDLPPPEWNWSQHAQDIEKAETRLMEVLAGCMTTLASFPRKETIPDLFGRAYATVCQFCFECLVGQKGEAFAALYPSLFAASLRAYEQLGKQSRDLEPTSALVLTLEPLLDIQTLSGYAMIYSELFDMPSAWVSCMSTWDRYLQDNSHAREIVQYLVNTYQLRSQLFQISPRDVLRTEWELRFHAELRRMGLIDTDYGPWDEEPEVNHKSPLIRALCRGGYEPHIPPAEVFYAEYLLKRPESSGIDFRDRWDIADHVENERTKSAEGDDA